VDPSHPVREDGAHFGVDLGLMAHVITGAVLMLQPQTWCMVITRSVIQNKLIRTELLKIM
jgi:hypothetical protein